MNIHEYQAKEVLRGFGAPVPRGKAATTDAVTAADSCGDDRLRADTLLAETPYEYESPFVGPRGRAVRLHR